MHAEWEKYTSNKAASCAAIATCDTELKLMLRVCGGKCGGSIK